ncbi:MAG: orotate phosphoribosyltransferase [Fimbriimonadaceae bacterium]|nr:orotate phosphoribosyltransferase [Fimbriimonadaceae bacterium]
MADLDLDALLESCGGLLRGHFLLTSGRHSDLYVEKFRILERPDVLSALCARIADRFRADRIQVVAGPTTGGIIIAFEVARQLGCEGLYVETEDGVKTLRRNAMIAPGARVLVVDDVLTTGRSVFEVNQVVRAAGGTVAGVAVLIDRSESSLDFGAPFYAAHRVAATSYPCDAVPDWLAAIPVLKPGTRKG